MTMWQLGEPEVYFTVKYKVGIYLLFSSYSFDYNYPLFTYKSNNLAQS